MLAVRPARVFTWAAHLAPPVVFLGLMADPASLPAQSIPGAREWAEAVVELHTPKWEGPVVSRPPERPRPALASTLRSPLRPLAVHFDVSTRLERAEEALQALEHAYDVLDAAGWPRPWPDGGRGGTAGFDLYLVSVDGQPTAAFPDAPVLWAPLDGVSAFGAVDPDLPDPKLAPCITSAYAQAILLGQDPAEAESWRRATADWLAWMVTDRWGDEEAVSLQQQEPFRPWIAETTDAGSGGALLLALFSARHDGGTGVFVREAWQLARQQSGPKPVLRGSPDVWMALERTIAVAGGDIRDDIEEFAVARYFAGSPERRRHQTWPALRALPPEARVPLDFQFEWSRLPRRTRIPSPELAPFGSAYGQVDVAAAPSGSLLEVWLRGEYGVQWSLVAVRLDEEGRELARIPIPRRKQPRSYIPLELTDDTASVLLVVTNLSSRLPDADFIDENARAFHLIVDRREPD